MKRIALENFNFHEIFRKREINVGDIVENLRCGGGIDIIVKVDQEDSRWGYVVYGHSKTKDGEIIERKYWTREHVNNEIMKKFSSTSKEAAEYHRKLEELTN